LELVRHLRLGDLRFVGGLLCVLTVVAVLAAEVPGRFHSIQLAVDGNSWRSPVKRLIHTGEMTNIPTDFQEAALTYVPPRSTFAVLPLPSPENALKYHGIPSVTLVDVPYWMQYLLLPSRMVDPGVAQYVLCFACDTAPWDKRTTWIWKNTAGEAIGKVNGR
jgi:hypothetical protein